MKIFIAIMFICQGGTCGFLQSEDFYYSEKECLAVLQSGMNDAKQTTNAVQGICIDVDLKKSS